MKIKIVSQYCYSTLPYWAVITKRRLIKYCEKNKYDLFIQEKRIKEDCCITWDKMYLVEEFLESEYDYIVWIDADMYINNMHIKFEDMIEENFNIFVDSAGAGSFPNVQLNSNLKNLHIDFSKIQFINTGIMIWKVCKENRELMSDFLNSKEYEFWLFNGWWEETAFEMYLNKLNYPSVKVFEPHKVSICPYYHEHSKSLETIPFYHFVGKSAKNYIERWSK